MNDSLLCFQRTMDKNPLIEGFSKTKTKKFKVKHPKTKVFRSNDPLLSVFMWGINHTVRELQHINVPVMLMPDDFRSFSKIKINNHAFNKENLPSNFKVKEYCPLVFRNGSVGILLCICYSILNFPWRQKIRQKVLYKVTKFYKYMSGGMQKVTLKYRKDQGRRTQQSYFCFYQVTHPNKTHTTKAYKISCGQLGN